MAAAKAVFKSIAVAEPRVRGEAKAGLIAALQHRYELTREAVLARAAAGVDQALLSAAQQISTVRVQALRSVALLLLVCVTSSLAAVRTHCLGWRLSN